MTRLRILLDCDGVLADFLTPALATMNRLAGTSKKLEDMKTWYLFDAFEGLEVPKDLRKRCYDEWKEPGWCKSLPVLPGAREGVEKLRAFADVFVCTSPMNGETWTYEREEWLKKHFNLTRDEVIHTNAKIVCSGDILVDDKTEHCVNWRRCHPDGVAVRWKQFTNITTPYDGPTFERWFQLESLATHMTMRMKEHRRWTHQTT